MNQIQENGYYRWRKAKNKIYQGLFFVTVAISLLSLAALLIGIFVKGLPTFNLNFLDSYPSRFASQAGIKSALFGTLAFISVTAPLAFVIGVGTAVYLEEYASKNWITRLLQLNIANLAGIPSIVYGMLGLVIFVRGLDLGRSVLAGSLTMTLLILPIIIVSSQEAIKAVPVSLRHASYALGGNVTQTVFRVVLPVAMPGILTGAILSVSRAIGETAPLIVIGALTYVAFLPTTPFSEFTVLPIQIFNWVSRPQPEFHNLAASGIILLLIFLISLNAGAVYLRNKYRKSFD